MNKKAAIELSVTAIVILILAIVILGLGLGFIRGMFGKAAASFEEQIAVEPEPPTASMADPFTLSRETLVTHAGDPEVLKVMVYNSWSAAGGGGGGGGLRCIDISTISSLSSTYKTYVCQAGATSLNGCTYNAGSDTCTGTATGCPGYIANFVPAAQRQTACESAHCDWDGTANTCTYSGGGGGGGGGDTVVPDIICGQDANNVDVMEADSLQVNSKDIESGRKETFNVVFTIGDVAEGTYLCKAEISQGFEKDFTIKVAR
jgi:hypothetical protein